MPATIRVVIADDHPLFRGGVARTLEEYDGITVVGEGGSAGEAVELVETTMPDVVCLDISMPGGGLEAARIIGSRYPAVRILMLTVSESDDDVLKALQVGASGYALKGIGGDELVDVLRGVAGGASYVSPSLAARILTAMQTPEPANTEVNDLLSTLTKREEQILNLVAKGKNNKEVGNILDIREKTVKHYMTNILQKLQIRNRVEAAMLARERAGKFA